MMHIPSAFDDLLPDRTLRWVLDVTEPDAVVESVRRLYGGISSAMHAVTLRVGEGVREVVVRRFDNAAWVEEEPDLALHEAASLRRAARSGLPVPELIAFDETGSACGLPAVVMTRLAGEVVLRPGDMDRWVEGLAAALAQVHAVDADGFPWEYFTYGDMGSLETPSWSGEPGVWEAAIAILGTPRPEARECFIHRDYHPANLLWSGGRVSGVVDWVNACRGPAGIDVGHCRANLAQLFDVATADAFLAAYRRHAGAAFRYDPYWDILSLIDMIGGAPTVYPGWEALGVTGLTDRLMAVRVESYLASLVARASGG